MTSSFLLQQRFAQGNTWRFGDPNAPYQGMEDHYIRPWGECHPDFEAHPIGSPTGAKVCVRRKITETRAPESPRPNGYYRGNVNLYSVTDEVPTQKWNPYPYHDRRIPYEGQLVRDGYVDIPTRFNGTGINLPAVPAEITRKDQAFYQFPYSFMPNEDPKTGLRVASKMTEQVPPPKYDVTRLIQPFDLWQLEQQRMRGLTPNQISEFSARNTRRIIS